MRCFVSILIAYSSTFWLALILCPESVTAEPLNLMWYYNEIGTYVSYVTVTCLYPARNANSTI